MQTCFTFLADIYYFIYFVIVLTISTLISGSHDQVRQDTPFDYPSHFKTQATLLSNRRYLRQAPPPSSIDLQIESPASNAGHAISGPLGSLPKSPFQPSARSHIARILRLFWIQKLMDIPTIYGLLNGFLVQFFAPHPDFIM